MSTTPDAVARRWAIQLLNADATLVALIAGGKAMKTLPRNLNTTDGVIAGVVGKPGLTVGVQGAGLPIGAIRSGNRTFAAQEFTLRVQAMQQTFSGTQLEAVMGRVMDLLDGVHNQTPVISSLYEIPLPDIVEPQGDVQIITASAFYKVVVIQGA